jgi:predicted DNA-binding WGR domain protein
MTTDLTRYLEFTDAKSSKFWEITLTGGIVVVRFGKSGTQGQSQEMTFADAEAAAKHAAKLIAEKTGKGYIERGTQQPGSAPDSSAPADPKATAAVAVTKPARPAKSAKPKNPVQDPEATAESLLALLDKDDATNRILAKHTKASAELLKKLSHSSDQATRRSVAANANTPSEVFVHLAQQFPKEFLANPQLDLLLLENPALLSQLPESTLTRLLKLPECPAALLTWAAAHRSEKLQLAATMNPSAGLEAKKNLRQSQHAAVREAAQPNAVGVEQDPETAFEQAVRKRFGSMARWELEEAWRAGDIGLAQWSALPLDFRLHCTAGGFWVKEDEAVIRLLSDLGWSLADVQTRLPKFDRWVTVARSLNTPVSVLAALSTDSAAGVRKSVAGNPNTTVLLLKALTKDSDAAVRSSVAWNPNTPELMLAELAKDSHNEVRSLVAENRNTPVSALEALGKDRASSVRCGVAANPRAPESVMEGLARDSDRDVRLALARNLHAPVRLLDELVQESAVRVREAVAQNPSSPASALCALSKDSRASVRMAVAKNPACPAAVLEALAEDANLEIRDAVAQSPVAPPRALEALLNKSGRSVHWELAKNPATPTEVLERLSRIDDPWIQAKVAGHPSLHVERRRELLEVLSKLPSEDSRNAAGKNPAMPASTLETLFRDSKQSVRLAVASNAQCPPEVLARLAKDGSAVQEALARNRNTPLEVLVELTASQFPQVRKALVIHAHRSAELRRKLGADPDEDVREAIASCPGLTGDMLDELLQGDPLESDLMTLFAHANLRPASAMVIAEKLFNTPALQSPWFLQEMAKASEDVQAAAKAGSVLAYFGKDPNREVLAKRPLAAIMALCAGPYLEPERIAKVVGSTDWLVRAAVARSPATPPNLLKKLSSDVHPLVSALACQSLAEAESAEVPSGAASHVSAPLNLERAVTEILRRMREEGFGWSVTPLLNCAAWRARAQLDEVLSWLKRFEEFDAWVQSLLTELDESQRDLFWLWAAGARDGEVRMRLVQHSAVPLAALERFSTDPSAAVLIAVATKAELPKALRSKVEKAALRAIMSRGASFREQMALHAPAAPTFVQERLARDEHRVRSYLGVTAALPDWMTRGGRSGSQGAKSEDLRVEAFALEGSVGVDANAAVRKQMNLDWMDCLRQAFQREVLVRQGEPPPTAAPLTTADVLSALAWLDCVPATETAVPTKPSRSSDWLSRFGAALHPGATEGILAILRKDSDPDVAHAANRAVAGA